jgi:hypothetical protein
MFLQQGGILMLDLILTSFFYLSLGAVLGRFGGETLAATWYLSTRLYPPIIIRAGIRLLWQASLVMAIYFVLCWLLNPEYNKTADSRQFANLCYAGILFGFFRGWQPIKRHPLAKPRLASRT